MASSRSGSMRPYQPGKRAMLKIKHQRTADCVVAGFRWHKNGPGHPHRVAPARAVRRRRQAQPRRHHLVVLVGPPGRAGRGARAAPRRRARRTIRGANGPNGRAMATPTPPASACRAPPRAGTAARTCRGSRSALERVAEVAYDHLQGSRFRHATTFKRWRPDKPPEACRYDQLEETAPFLLAHIFGGDG